MLLLRVLLSLLVCLAAYSSRSLSSTSPSFNKYYGTDDEEEFGNILSISDGGFLLVGTTYTSGNADILVVRVSASGDMLWSYSFGGN